MTLLTNEEIESKFFVKETKTDYIITNKRIVVSSENNSEHYPIDKITCVKSSFKRNDSLLMSAIFMFLLSFCIIAICKGILIKFIPFENLFPIMMLSFFITIGLSIYNFIRWIYGETTVIIGHFGGEQKIIMRGKNEYLMSFANKVIEKLF